MKDLYSTTYFRTMVSCAKLSCHSRKGVHSKKISKITFHKFPRDPERLKKWIRFVSRSSWLPTKTSVLCSKHFVNDQFDLTSKCYIRLKEDAVPTIDIIQVQLASTSYAINGSNTTEKLEIKETEDSSEVDVKTEPEEVTVEPEIKYETELDIDETSMPGSSKRIKIENNIYVKEENPQDFDSFDTSNYVKIENDEIQIKEENLQ